MDTKQFISVMVLAVASNQGYIMAPHIFESCLRVNFESYVEVLERVVKPWMDQVTAGRVIQQDCASAHKAKKRPGSTITCPTVGPDFWPPSNPDCNPLDYSV
ncbi:conserved hypothetical protein [Ixodes scapularis]|uniref:Tc1-like transposase DDE domain-containing protein n=1 Tax=Ixodes scapularis TaxID=6945 RepID=B7Q6L2_IXOSC|nr:conserved hypothetical protein [Ixodes scapularis]|eukprot:XP_002403126.1 conserved hypothetical protein [Ixodes scapularis]